MHNKVMGRPRTGFTEVYAQSLNADCDLNIWPSDMVFVRDTEAYAQSLSADCDLDLWLSDMVLVCDTSSCHDYHLC